MWKMKRAVPRRISSWTKSLLVIALAAILLSAAPALAQTTETPSFTLEVTEVGSDCIWLEWDRVGSYFSQGIYSASTAETVFSGTQDAPVSTGAISYQYTGLTAETTYYFGLGGTTDGVNQVSVESNIVSATTLAAGTTCGATPPGQRLNLADQYIAIGSECIWVTWPQLRGVTMYTVKLLETGSNAQPPTYDIEETLYLFTDLTANTEYTVEVTPSTGLTEQIVVTTNTDDDDTLCPSRSDVLTILFPPSPSSSSGDDATWVPTPKPPANTCPELLPGIVITGYVPNASQCQVVEGAGVGRQDLLDRGVVAAVDVWSLVPNAGVEVCFLGTGAAVVFLDAAYSPRLLSSLTYTMRGGHTCTTITTTGTVVLLAS